VCITCCHINTALYLMLVVMIAVVLSSLADGQTPSLLISRVRDGTVW